MGKPWDSLTMSRPFSLTSETFGLVLCKRYHVDQRLSRIIQ